MARILNSLGPNFRHSIVALDGDIAAAATLAGDVAHEVLPLTTRKSNLPSTLLRCRATLMRSRPELLVTYNWGAIEWAMANRLFTRLPHIHHEAGFGSEEVSRQIPRRVYFRRWALRRTYRVIVPSHSLERIATEAWRLPRSQVLYIANGIDLARFRPHDAGREPPARTSGRRIIGSLVPLRPEKNVGRLIAAFAHACARADLGLIIAGDGSERPRLEAMARTLDVADRVRFLGHVARPELALREIDIFALSSDTEQMPYAVLEAMAAALPVAAVDVGDIADMVAPENRPYIAERADTAGLAEAFVRLAADRDLCARLGQANLARVRARYSHEAMVAHWSAVFLEALAARVD
ncbi:MAG TPA: glycosyltransferase family 4 protein [Alphaproteobacteria bacterium]|nr:glycosyltransferase family 4 protein [Alphaproteobacteria bacterium]